MAGRIRTWLSRFVVEPLRQIWLLLSESLSLRRRLVNRFTILLVIIALTMAGAGAYMDATDGNQLTGTVVTEGGTPVENATVSVRVVGIENQVASHEVVTDEAGQFVVEKYSGPGNSGIDLRIRVQTDDGYASQMFYQYAYFPGQSIDVRLQLDRPGGPD